MIKIFNFLATIRCDFENDWCNFNKKSNGDNSSITGLEWRRHNGKYIEEQKLDGPYTGRNQYEFLSSYQYLLLSIFYPLLLLISLNSNSVLLDHNGNKDTVFAIAGLEDKDANSATTLLTTPGFIGKQHPRECLSFWYRLKV